MILDHDLAAALDARVAELAASGFTRSEVVRNLLRRSLGLSALERDAGYVEGRMAGLAEVKRAFAEAADASASD